MARDKEPVDAVRRERRADAEGASRCSRNGAATGTATSCAWSDARSRLSFTELTRISPMRRSRSNTKLIVAYRLSGRRPGLGRRHHALCRPHAPAERHDASSTSPTRATRACWRASMLPEGWHSHKVRVAERHHDRQPREARRRRRRISAAGSASTTCRKPAAPKLITKWMTAGKGVHRYDFDGRYAYISPTAEGYVGNIVMILDLADPAKPEGGRPLVDSRPVAGRRRGISLGRLACRRAATIRCASATGSMSATGTTASSSSIFPTCRSRRRSRTSIPARRFRIPPTPACAMPQPLKGRDIMVVADEDVAKLGRRRPPSPGSTTSPIETQPMPIATFQVPGLDKDGSPQPPMTGCHQPSERFQRHASFRSPGSRKGCGWSTSPIPSPRRRSAITCPIRRPARERAVVQRRDDRRSRADLSGRPHARRRHHRNQRSELRPHERRSEAAQRRLSDRQEEPEPAVPSGGARRRLHLRLRPGRQGRERQHDRAARSRKRRRHHRRRSAASSRRKARRSRMSCG